MIVNAGNFFDRDQSLPVKYYHVCLLCHLAIVSSAIEDKKKKKYTSWMKLVLLCALPPPKRK